MGASGTSNGPNRAPVVGASSPPPDSKWDLRSLAQCVLAAPTDSGTVNVWIARDLARAALDAADKLLGLPGHAAGGGLRYPRIALTPEQELELRQYADGLARKPSQPPNTNLIRRNMLTRAPTFGFGWYRITEFGRAVLAERQ